MESIAPAASAAPTASNNDAQIKVNLKVEGMMCQKNCGSTVQRSLLNMDLSDARQCLDDKLQQLAQSSNPRAAAAVKNKEIGIRVIDAEADFATSYAAVTIQWNIKDSDDMISMHDDNEDFDLEDPNDGAAELLSALSTGEMRREITEKLVAAAIDEVECVGFDAEWLATDEDVNNHRERARKEREEAQQRKVSSRPQSAHSSTDGLFEIGDLEEDVENNINISGGGATATFHVGGMSCAVCTGSVERFLLSVGGGDDDNNGGRPQVVHAAVSLPTNTARVAFSPLPSSVLNDEGNEMRVYQNLAEECAAVVSKGGYACEILNVQLSNSSSKSGSGGNGGTSLIDSAARMERTRQAELRQWKCSLVTSLAFTVPLAIIHFSTMKTAMGWENDPGGRLPPTVYDWMMLILATPVQFGVGKRFYVSAWRGLVHGCTMGME